MPRHQFAIRFILCSSRLIFSYTDALGIHHSAEEFIGDDHLGHNIFAGHGLNKRAAAGCEQQEGATVFGYYVDAIPERYCGVYLSGNWDVPFPSKKSAEKPNQLLRDWTTLIDRSWSTAKVALRRVRIMDQQDLSGRREMDVNC